jgi:hypothetical protein
MRLEQRNDRYYNSNANLSDLKKKQNHKELKNIFNNENPLITLHIIKHLSSDDRKKLRIVSKNCRNTVDSHVKSCKINNANILGASLLFIDLKTLILTDSLHQDNIQFLLRFKSLKVIFLSAHQEYLHEFPQEIRFHNIKSYQVQRRDSLSAVVKHLPQLNHLTFIENKHIRNWNILSLLKSLTHLDISELSTSLIQIPQQILEQLCFLKCHQAQILNLSRNTSFPCLKSIYIKNFTSFNQISWLFENAPNLKKCTLIGNDKFNDLHTEGYYFDFSKLQRIESLVMIDSNQFNLINDFSGELRLKSIFLQNSSLPLSVFYAAKLLVRLSLMYTRNYPWPDLSVYEHLRYIKFEKNNKTIPRYLMRMFHEHPSSSENRLFIRNTAKPTLITTPNSLDTNADKVAQR